MSGGNREPFAGYAGAEQHERVCGAARRALIGDLRFAVQHEIIDVLEAVHEHRAVADHQSAFSGAGQLDEWQGSDIAGIRDQNRVGADGNGGEAACLIEEGLTAELHGKRTVGMTAKHGFKPKLVGDSRLVKALRTVGEDDLAGATQPGGNPREPIETRTVLHTVGIVDYALAGELKIIENIVALRQRSSLLLSNYLHA